MTIVNIVLISYLESHGFLLKILIDLYQLMGLFESMY